MKRFLVMLLVALCVAGASGCVPGGSPGSSDGGSGQKKASASDSAGKAVAAATAVVRASVDDAVPMSVGTGGVAYQLPPDSWNVLFYSPSKGAIYRVAVEHGRAGSVESMGDVKLDDAALASGMTYDDVKVGSAEAFESAKTALEASGGSPTDTAMMSLNMMKLPTSQSAVGEWTVIFTQGTSNDNTQKVLVDCKTGDARSED